jgi:hypothetical protein
VVTVSAIAQSQKVTQLTERQRPAGTGSHTGGWLALVKPVKAQVAFSNHFIPFIKPDGAERASQGAQVTTDAIHGRNGNDATLFTMNGMRRANRHAWAVLTLTAIEWDSKALIDQLYEHIRPASVFAFTGYFTRTAIYTTAEIHVDYFWHLDFLP